MATFISLIEFTQHGEEEIKKSADRAAAFRQTATNIGAEVKDVYWTLGNYDGVLVFEAPNDEIATTLMLTLGSKGNVRTQTLRAFNADQINAILESMP
ncbi:MAG: GYD domain-containing protein [Planctomycetota bacterium]|jgi:uncharacterized protein with GYD domain